MFQNRAIAIQNTSPLIGVVHLRPATIAAVTRAVDCVSAFSGVEEVGVNGLRNDAAAGLSPEAVEAWKAQPNGRRGAQPKFSGFAIETALTLGLDFHLPLRQCG